MMGFDKGSREGKLYHLRGARNASNLSAPRHSFEMHENIQTSKRKWKAFDYTRTACTRIQFCGTQFHIDLFLYLNLQCARSKRFSEITTKIKIKFITTPRTKLSSYRKRRFKIGRKKKEEEKINGKVMIVTKQPCLFECHPRGHLNRK